MKSWRGHFENRDGVCEGSRAEVGKEERALKMKTPLFKYACRTLIVLAFPLSHIRNFHVIAKYVSRLSCKSTSCPIHNQHVSSAKPYWKSIRDSMGENECFPGRLSRRHIWCSLILNYVLGIPFSFFRFSTQDPLLKFLTFTPCVALFTIGYTN